MVEKENLAPGVPFEPLFRGIRSQELLALISDTFLFLLIGVLALWVILALSLDFRQYTSFFIAAAAVVVAVLIFLLYRAVRASMRHIKRDHQRAD